MNKRFLVIVHFAGLVVKAYERMVAVVVAGCSNGKVILKAQLTFVFRFDGRLRSEVSFLFDESYRNNIILSLFSSNRGCFRLIIIV